MPRNLISHQRYKTPIKPVLISKQDSLTLGRTGTVGLPYRDLIVLDLKKKLTQQSDKVKMLTEDNQTLKKEAITMKESN